MGKIKYWVIVLFLVLLSSFLIVVSPLIFLNEVMQLPHTPYIQKSDNPNDIWVGGSDGGVFIEIISSKPPEYCIRVKSDYYEMRESGEYHEIIESGLVYFDGDLSKAKFNFYSAHEIYLQNHDILLIKRSKRCH